MSTYAVALHGRFLPTQLQRSFHVSELFAVPFVDWNHGRLHYLLYARLTRSFLFQIRSGNAAKGTQLLCSNGRYPILQPLGD
jgi:hypothetical protein